VKHNGFQQIKMETNQNVTLTILKSILRKAKILAIQRNTSLSALLAQTLTDLVEREEGYEQARLRSLETLKKGFDLGTHGNIFWKREDLHER
jgi:hypothetical protein